jgi:hypothetical protein
MKARGSADPERTSRRMQRAIERPCPFDEKSKRPALCILEEARGQASEATQELAHRRVNGSTPDKARISRLSKGLPRRPFTQHVVPESCCCNSEREETGLHRVARACEGKRRCSTGVSKPDG